MEPILESINEQIARAKERAESFHRSLQSTREQEQKAIEHHEKEVHSLAVEKELFEKERQKWAKSIEEKSSMVQQLERELSSTVDALHASTGWRNHSSHHYLSLDDNNESKQLDIDVSSQHHPGSMTSHHPKVKGIITSHCFYTEDGRRHDDRKEHNTHSSHVRNHHDYLKEPCVQTGESMHGTNVRGIYGAWVASPENNHDVVDPHVPKTGVKGTRTHDPTIPMVQHALHSDVLEGKKEISRLHIEVNSLQQEVETLRQALKDSEGRLKLKLDQVSAFVLLLHSLLARFIGRKKIMK